MAAVCRDRCDGTLVGVRWRTVRTTSIASASSKPVGHLVGAESPCPASMDAMSEIRSLPHIDEHGQLERTLFTRRSTKRFADRPLTLADAARAMWAVAGTTADGRRVCPSARATYPVTTTLVAGRIEELPTGAYLYDPMHHAIETVQSGDHRRDVADATLDGADWLPTCPALVLLSADMVAARDRFPDQAPTHGERFVWIEVGHAAQNLYLWAAEHDVGTALIAGLDDARATESCHDVLPQGHQLLGILPLGRPAS